MGRLEDVVDVRAVGSELDEGGLEPLGGPGSCGATGRCCRSLMACFSVTLGEGSAMGALYGGGV